MASSERLRGGYAEGRADPKETLLLAVCIRLAAAIHGYLAFYMPSAS